MLLRERRSDIIELYVTSNPARRATPRDEQTRATKRPEPARQLQLVTSGSDSGVGTTPRAPASSRHVRLIHVPSNSPRRCVHSSEVMA